MLHNLHLACTAIKYVIIYKITQKRKRYVWHIKRMSQNRYPNSFWKDQRVDLPKDRWTALSKIWKQGGMASITEAGRLAMDREHHGPNGKAEWSADTLGQGCIYHDTVLLSCLEFPLFIWYHGTLLLSCLYLPLFMCYINITAQYF